MKCTTRSELRRCPSRGSHDWTTISRILDVGSLAHVGFSMQNQPFVIPTLYGRREESRYLYGSAASRMVGELETGISACIMVTLDGLVLSRSAFDHSTNYRSVVVFRTARKIIDPVDKAESLRVISEHLIPGRWADVRGPSDRELEATTVLEFLIDEVSCKIRTGPPLDDKNDYGFPVWAGVLAVELRVQRPIADEPLLEGIFLPGYVRCYEARSAVERRMQPIGNHSGLVQS